MSLRQRVFFNLSIFVYGTSKKYKPKSNNTIIMIQSNM